MIKEIKYENLTKIEEKSWTYILYKYQDKYILSVMCGSIALYDVNIIVDDSIIKQFENKGITVLDELASIIRDNSDKYSQEHIDLIK